jgi:predicted dinucleotide-binding enzyme
MSCAIVGFGQIGQALAHAFARKNIKYPLHPRLRSTPTKEN